MYLQDIINQLIHGELTQTSFGNSGIDTLDASDIDKLITHTNLALTALHKRFNVRQKELFLQLYEEVEEYYLRPDFAVNSGSSEPIKYIVDTPTNRFLGGVLKVEAVVDEAELELPINEGNNPDSIFTPALDILQIPYSDGDKTYSVIYRANHESIALGSDPSTTPITLNESYFEPLLLFIAARYHSTQPLLDGTNQGVMFMQKYEMACRRIEDFGLNVTETEEDTRLWRNGWV